MKKIFISLFLLASVLDCGAQSKCSIAKAYAFYTVSAPGMIMTDDNGNPIPPKLTIARYIYIEWCGTAKPEIETVLYNNKPLSATCSAIKGKTVIPGDYQGHNSEFKIIAKKCKTLWRINLQAPESIDMPEQDCKNIIIKTRAANKSCTLKLVKETQLATMPRY